MSCGKQIKRLIIIVLAFALIACDIQDDLLPTSNDQRGAVIPGSIGYHPTQIAADFTIKDSLNNDFTLSEHLAGGSDPADVIVLYFSMWCPICLSHTDYIYTNIMPQFSGRGKVIYGIVDYVSGSVAATRATEIANGYAGSSFTVLADVDQGLMNQFNAAMSITVVINSDGTILMNEDFRDGSELIKILDQQLP